MSASVETIEKNELCRDHLTQAAVLSGTQDLEMTSTRDLEVMM